MSEVMKKALRKFSVFALALMLAMTMFPAFSGNYAYAATNANATLTFTDSGITESGTSTGCTIDGTSLEITAAGTYVLSGSCSEGSIEVAKGLDGVILVLDGLSLSSSSTAPVVIKKGTSATIHLESGTTSTITNNEDPANETSTDTTVADAFEGACIKVKSGSTVTFCGGGTLNVVANAKNGIKGSSTSALIFNLDTDAGKVAVSGNYSGYATSAGAVNNGIASDGSVTINSGIFDIDAANDGIKSTPDATDETEGTTIDTASAGTVTINGGAFDIDVDGDAIQADTALTVTKGSFDIKTMNGYNTKGTKYNINTNGSTSSSYDFDSDTMSSKGLKASGDRAEEAGIEPALNVSGGTFTFDTAEDALHSDAHVTVTGGTFDISTGDDGMHGDTTLNLGTENSTVERDPDVTINYSYEGLEAGTVNMYSGRYYVNASDDGVNAAGGSSSGTDQGQGDDPFNPWGGGFSGQDDSSSGDYSINIYGGDLYVNCDGDGLDSNGDLYLQGGTQEVFSQSQGDNSSIDADGTVSIDGATVFTAGIESMMDPVSSSWFGSDQSYKSMSSSLSAGKAVNATLNGTVIYSTSLPKAASYFMYSAPGLSGTPTLSTASSATACKGGSWSHNWNDGVVTTAATATSAGVKTYTCSTCGAAETQTIPAAGTTYACEGHVEEVTCTHENITDPAWTWADDYSSATLSGTCADCGETVSFDGTVTSVLTDSNTITFTATYTLNGTEYTDTKTAAPFTGTFSCDGGVESVDVYYTQDYTTADEEGVTTAVARDSDTGCPVITGNGQINFKVNTKDGYHVSAVTADANYKNVKGPADLGVENTYRVTKITGDLTITVTTQETHTCTYGDPVWTWADDYSTATATFTCTGCGAAETIEATVTSETTDNTTTYTAALTFNGTDYSDTRTVTNSDSGDDSTDTGLGEDGTAFGKGAEYSVVDAAIKSLTSDADPAGTTYRPLMVKSTKQSTKAIKLTWKKVSGASKYVIYSNKCGKSNKMKRLKVLTSSKSAYTVKKSAGKKLKKGTYYKFIVVALDSENKVISTSKIVHVATKGGKVGNWKSMKIKTPSSSKKTLAVGKTFTIKVKMTKASGVKVKNHRSVRYESSNKAVATVGAKSGKVTAKSAGTCYIYAYAQNGICKRVKITVK